MFLLLQSKALLSTGTVTSVTQELRSYIQAHFSQKVICFAYVFNYKQNIPYITANAAAVLVIPGIVIDSGREASVKINPNEISLCI